MRIADLSSTYQSLPQLQRIQQQQNIQQEQLTTGRKINRIEQDPATAHRLLESMTTRQQMVQFNANAHQANTIAQEGVQTLEYLRSLADRAEQMINDTDLRGAAAARQVDQMITDALAAANTRHGNDFLFAGEASEQVPFTQDAATGQITYNGSGEGRSFNISTGTSLSPFTGDSANRGIESFLNTLASLRDGLQSGDDVAIEDAAAALQQADDELLQAGSELGLKQFRIEILQERDAAKFAALDHDETRATAADPTETIVGLLNTQKAYQGALQSVGLMSKLSLLNYV